MTSCRVRIGALLLAVSVLAWSLASCRRGDGPRVIDTDRIDEPASNGAVPDERALRVAVGSMSTPKRGFIYYRQLIRYVGRRLGRPAKSVDTKTYAELNKLFREGGIDMAFVCSMPYVYGKEHAGMELLVAPQVRGELVYYAYIIVPSDSPATCLRDLEGRTFAFCDPLSNTGTLVPTFMLAKMGKSADSFFRRYTYTYAHDKTIAVVGQKAVDGGAVHSLIWEYEKRSAKGNAARTRVIERSAPYGIPPVVVPAGLDPDLKSRLKEILLEMHEIGDGAQILKGMMIDRFVHVEDSAYESIREMNRVLSERKVSPE